MPRASTTIDWSVTPWDELAATGDELLAVLDDERDALLGRDPAALERTVERKLALLSSIETMLRAHAARPRDEQGADTALRARVDQVLEEAIRRNELNGRIAAQRELGVRQALDVITGKSATPTVYGRGGRDNARRGGHAIGVA
jgi:flagellar biosynthesis/type III secretory pathway chaperone